MQKLLTDGFSSENLALRVAEAMHDELTFPGIVSDPGAFAQSIYELAHLKHAVSLSEVEGLRLLSGEQAAHGHKFRTGRKSGTPGPIRKAVANLLKRNPEAKNSELWEAVRRRPPKGWQAFETPKLGKYLECPPKNMSYARFCNVCAEERKRLKGKVTG